MAHKYHSYRSVSSDGKVLGAVVASDTTDAIAWTSRVLVKVDQKKGTHRWDEWAFGGYKVVCEDTLTPMPMDDDTLSYPEYRNAEEL